MRGFAVAVASLLLSPPFFAQNFGPLPPLTERVDYVLTGPGITPLSETLFNTSPSEMFDGLWPTDHAAIAATIGLDPLPQN